MRGRFRNRLAAGSPHPVRSRGLDLSPRAGRGFCAVAITLLIAATALVLYAMGRAPICTCGSVKMWHGVVQSSENSQHLTDWYSFTHLIHGFLLYAACHGAGRLRVQPLRPGVGLLVAALVECGWEIVENTDYVIAHYRTATLSLHYVGDSIVNSVSDIAAALIGFGLAAWLPAAAIILLALGIEAGLAVAIRDNLTLNVLSFLAPSDAIKAWQMNAPR